MLCASVQGLHAVPELMSNPIIIALSRPKATSPLAFARRCGGGQGLGRVVVRGGRLVSVMCVARVARPTARRCLADRPAEAGDFSSHDGRGGPRHRLWRRKACRGVVRDSCRGARKPQQSKNIVILLREQTPGSVVLHVEMVSVGQGQLDFGRSRETKDDGSRTAIRVLFLPAAEPRTMADVALGTVIRWERTREPLGRQG